MPYGTPQEVNMRTYTARFQTEEVLAGYQVVLVATVEIDNPNTTEVEDAFQAFIDFMCTNPSYTFLGAERTKEFGEEITATP